LPGGSAITAETMRSSLLLERIILPRADSSPKYFLAVLTIITGVATGIYPALKLSSHGSLNLMSDSDYQQGSKSVIRNILVILQFIIAVLLLSGIFIINQQLNYIQDKDIGFNKDQLLVLHLPSIQVREHAAPFLQAIKKMSSVESASGISSNILGIYWDRPYIIEDMEDLQLIASINVDPEFMNTLEMELLEGRNFSAEIDDKFSVIVNEDLVKEFGWEDPIGKIIKEQIDAENYNLFTVIGVMEDYHYHSLHEKVSPTMLKHNLGYIPHIAVRINPENLENTLKEITSLWNADSGSMKLEYSFADEEFYQLHINEFTMGKLFLIFTVLSILIACIGLIGLISYTTELRTKEICIRKIFGSSTGSIMKMLSLDLMKNVLLANLIGLPLTFFMIRKWLQNFAYKIEPDVWTFLLAGMISLLIALLTVSFHTLKAANSNPVKSLKYE